MRAARLSFASLRSHRNSSQVGIPHLSHGFCARSAAGRRAPAFSVVLTADDADIPNDAVGSAGGVAPPASFSTSGATGGAAAGVSLTFGVVEMGTLTGGVAGTLGGEGGVIGTCARMP